MRFLVTLFCRPPDILIYKAHCVPVGEDQLPHVEICREIVRRFHSIYKKEVFVEPQGLLTQTPRFLGLDGRKMSKSYHNAIALSDSSEVITEKISGMFTDPKRIRKTDPGHPEKCNVHSYYKIFKPDMIDEAADWCSHAKVGCRQCKGSFGNHTDSSIGAHSSQTPILRNP